MLGKSGLKKKLLHLLFEVLNVKRKRKKKKKNRKKTLKIVFKEFCLLNSGSSFVLMMFLFLGHCPAWVLLQSSFL